MMAPMALLFLIFLVGLLANVSAKSSKYATKHAAETDLQEAPAEPASTIISDTITLPITSREKFISGFRTSLGGSAFKYSEIPSNLRSHAIVEEGSIIGTETTEVYSEMINKVPFGTAYKYIQIDEYTEHGCLGKVNMSKAYIADVCVSTSNSTSEMYNFYVNRNSYTAVLSMWLNSTSCRGPSNSGITIPGTVGCLGRMKVSTPWFLYRPTYDAEFEK
jgi:hypothetical protein